MLVPFVIDTNSLAPDPNWTSAQYRACHRSLLDVWQNIGLLACDGDCFDNSRLKEAVEKLPQSIRSLWFELLQRVPVDACGNGWNGTVEVATLSDFCAAAQLAIVDDDRAEMEFGLPEECDEKTTSIAGCSDVDICRLLSANQAALFKRALALAGTHVKVGDTFQLIWDSRFKALARAPIKKVTVVDRYAITKHHEPDAATGLSGLERFLRLLDKDACGPRYVTVFSAWTADLHGKALADVEADLRLLFGRLQPKNIKRIKLHMAPNTAFRDDGHDRFVRFEGYVWDVGLGLEIFDGPFAAKRSSASFKSGLHVKGYTQIEQDLAGHAGTKSVTIP